MQIELNLASRPAGGYRAFFMLASLVAASLVAGAALLIASYLGSGRLPAELLEEERRLLAEQGRLSNLGAEATAKIRDIRAGEILDRTAFLNELLIRKGISWTRTFLDLAQVLPPNVRVLTIQPEVAYGDTIRLDMTVGARQPGDFIEFLKSLEGSELFGFPGLRGSAPPSDSDTTFRYQLAVEYDQQL